MLSRRCTRIRITPPRPTFFFCFKNQIKEERCPAETLASSLKEPGQSRVRPAWSYHEGIWSQARHGTEQGHPEGVWWWCVLVCHMIFLGAMVWFCSRRRRGVREPGMVGMVVLFTNRRKPWSEQQWEMPCKWTFTAFLDGSYLLLFWFHKCTNDKSVAHHILQTVCTC